MIAVVAAGLLGGCSSVAFPGLASIAPAPAKHAAAAGRTPNAGTEAMANGVSPTAMDGMIERYAALYDVPEALIRRVVVRESGYNPQARNGPYYGLMQIRYDTAMSMGYRGPASGLLDADTNLRYGVKYLSGAYMVGGKNPDQAVRNYARGYYYEAKRKGLLKESGLR